MSENKQEFGKIRSFFWPVHLFELRKVFPMLLMMFFISFNYTVLRDLKDTLVVTSTGAETIPFLKVWGVVPCAVVFMLIFSKLSNVLRKETLFYVTIAPFILFFALFPILIYPNRDLLHPNAFADSLQAMLPQGFAGLIGCMRNWTYSLFYILSELWGSAVLSLLFWGFANEICRVSEAKRFYTLFILGANVALLLSGPAIYFSAKIRSSLPADVDAWQITLNYLMSMVTASGLGVMATYWWINRNVLTDPRFYDPAEVKTKKKKAKLSIVESFAYLARSKYVLSIAALVLAYNVCINLVEVTWKGQLKLQYANPNDYAAFMGIYSTLMGFATIGFLFIASYLIRRFGWGFGAAFNPVIMLITGGLFFAFVIFRDQLAPFLAFLGTTPLFLAVVIGMVQNVMTKSTKYAFFDPTKEMAYIPLDQEAKVKGKAAIDVVGARLGKSGGSFIQQILIIALGSLGAITPYIAVVIFGVIALWLASVRYLNREFTTLTGEKKSAEEKPLQTAEPVRA